MDQKMAIIESCQEEDIFSVYTGLRVPKLLLMVVSHDHNHGSELKGWLSYSTTKRSKG